MAIIEPSVLRARVSHCRQQPVVNQFTYGIDYLLLDEAAIEQGKGPRLFSFGQFNLVSLQPTDHGIKEYTNIKDVRRLAHESGVKGVDQILLLTHPRYWGYTFNPVSFWLIFDKSQQLLAVISEVHNTYGDRHAYLCTSANGNAISSDSWLIADKLFHVSPFFDIKGTYKFRFIIEDSRIGIWINYNDGNGGGLYTAIIGDRQPFTDRELVYALIRRPLGAAKTTLLIHWQALRLWCKGLRFRRRTDPPSQSVTR